jgi:uncharacterized protein (DUF885 family)
VSSKSANCANWQVRSWATKFDLAAFHDTVLGQGSVPLNVLEDMVKDWIAAEKAKA